MPGPFNRGRSLTRAMFDAIVNEFALNARDGNAQLRSPAARCAREADEVAALTAHCRKMISTPNRTASPQAGTTQGTLYGAAL